MKPRLPMMPLLGLCTLYTVARPKSMSFTCAASTACIHWLTASAKTTFSGLMSLHGDGQFEGLHMLKLLAHSLGKGDVFGLVAAVMC